MGRDSFRADWRHAPRCKVEVSRGGRGPLIDRQVVAGSGKAYEKLRE